MADLFETTDAPDDITTPYSIALGNRFFGTLDADTDEDWVAVTLVAGRHYSFSLSSVDPASPLDPYLWLLDSSGVQIIGNDDSGSGTASLLRFKATTGGTYFLSAESYQSASAGDYALSVQFAETIGTNGDDLLFAGATHVNVVFGLDGNDLISGSDVRDSLFGGAGDDTLSGNDGSDILFGGAGNDLLDGDFHDDTLYGGPGTDLLFGAGGSDMLYGGVDDDKLFGMNGWDRLFGGTGQDSVFGGNFRDRLHGGDGNDLLSGNRGDDFLFGGTGDDRLHGGRDDDDLTGGAGADRFLFDFGSDTIRDFEDDIDTLQLEDALWTGQMTVQQVISTFASTDGTDTVFDFGNGVMLSVIGIGDPTLLADDLIIV